MLFSLLYENKIIKYFFIKVMM